MASYVMAYDNDPRTVVVVEGSWDRYSPGWRVQKSSGAFIDTSSEREVKEHGLSLIWLNTELRKAVVQKHETRRSPSWRLDWNREFEYLEYKILRIRPNGQLILLSLSTENGAATPKSLRCDLSISDLKHLSDPSTSTAHHWDSLIGAAGSKHMGQLIRWYVPRELQFGPKGSSQNLFAEGQTDIENVREQRLRDTSKLSGLPTELLDTVRKDTDLMHMENQIEVLL